MPNCCLDCAANADYRSLFYRGGLRRERPLSFTVLSRGTASRTPTIVHCSITGDCAANAHYRSLFYRGGLRRERRKRYAVRLVNAGNSHPHMVLRLSRDLRTLFSWRIARFWFAEVFFFDLFPSFALFAQTVLCVAFWSASPIEGRCPSNSPQALWRRA